MDRREPSSPVHMSRLRAECMDGYKTKEEVADEFDNNFDANEPNGEDGGGAEVDEGGEEQAESQYPPQTDKREEEKRCALEKERSSKVRKWARVGTCVGMCSRGSSHNICECCNMQEHWKIMHQGR
ncbi:hypothetical protein CBR_g55074 [Chara braunii]|uniref:Uncharacterized protein n=1 Tax=Chara braunii TaxID=69332 RepID=A0A388MCT1_CHABU|nr:hypothetical protein CBR_g55074 [Chara braunii]|eukprot:GBG92305.1 hypothetical protein CBR_g55074 [Chara braunii]